MSVELSLSFDVELLSDVRLIIIFGICVREDVIDELDVSGVVTDRVEASVTDEDELRVVEETFERVEFDLSESVRCNGHCLSKQDNRSCAGQRPLFASVFR